MRRTISKPTREQEMLFSVINRELKKRTSESLSDNARALIVADFVRSYDFSNSAIAHKSAGGWAQMIASEII